MMGKYKYLRWQKLVSRKKSCSKYFNITIRMLANLWCMILNLFPNIASEAERI